MKLLLDENLPKKLKTVFPTYKVYTVREMKWNGIKNGALLNLMLQNGFDVLLSFDQNMPHQQNFDKYPITVFVLIAPINTFDVLQPLCSRIADLLSSEVIELKVYYISE